MIARDSADVWVLLGPHKGDNNQVLALAEALGLPFRAIQMSYRWFAHLPAALRQVTIAQLKAAASAEIKPPWPSLVIGIGQRSAPVARHIQQASGGRTKIVRLGDPMVSHQLFDLVITTTQYAVRDADNVVRLPISLTNRQDVRPEKRELEWLHRFPRPLRLIVIGGKTSLWRLDETVVFDAARILKQRAASEGGSVIAVTSPRTDAPLLSAARAALGETAVVSGPFPRYAVLLRAANEIHVTGDSVSMLSDAVASERPVGLIPLRPNATAKFVHFVEALRGRAFRMRDLGQFWDDLAVRGLVGTIDHPRAGALEVSPLDTAVAAVRAIMDTQEILAVKTSTARKAQPAPKPLAL